MTRDATIFVSPQVLWSLGRVVKAHNSATNMNYDPKTQTVTETPPPMSVDGIANDILMQWIKQNRPKLIDLWSRREAINEEALKA